VKLLALENEHQVVKPPGNVEQFVCIFGEVTGHLLYPGPLKRNEVSEDLTFPPGAFNQFPDQAGMRIALWPGEVIGMNQITALFPDIVQRILKWDLLVRPRFIEQRKCRSYGFEVQEIERISITGL
jgi:hypothetical protein